MKGVVNVAVTGLPAEQSEYSVQYYTDNTYTEKLGLEQSFTLNECSKIVAASGETTWRTYTCSGETDTVVIKDTLQDCEDGNQINDRFDGTSAVHYTLFGSDQFYFVKCGDTPITPVVETDDDDDTGLIVGLSVGAAAILVAGLIIWRYSSAST